VIDVSQKVVIQRHEYVAVQGRCQRGPCRLAESFLAHCWLWLCNFLLQTIRDS